MACSEKSPFPHDKKGLISINPMEDIFEFIITLGKVYDW